MNNPLKSVLEYLGMVKADQLAKRTIDWGYFAMAEQLLRGLDRNARTPTEAMVDAGARAGYAARCKTNGPLTLAEYASRDIMQAEHENARVIVKAALATLYGEHTPHVGSNELPESLRGTWSPGRILNLSEAGQIDDLCALLNKLQGG